VRRRAVIGAIPVAVASAAVLGVDGCTASSGPPGPAAWRFFTADQAAVIEAAIPARTDAPQTDR